MVKKLGKEGLLESEKYGGVSLTKKGIEEARKIYRKHQLLEVFFDKILNLKNRFHHEAHNVEHALSEDAADRLEEVLKNPNVCPDGNPIPKKSRKITELIHLPENEEANILFSTTEENKCTERLNSLGLVPNTKVKILRKLSKGPLLVKIKGTEVALGRGICSKIYVERK